MPVYGDIYAGDYGASVLRWEAERMAVAENRIPALNRFQGTELLDADFVAVDGVGGNDGTPTPVPGKSCGIYRVPGGVADGWLSFGRFNDQKIIALPKTESWYLASRVRFPQTSFTTGGGYVSPILMVGLEFQVIGFGNQSTTRLQAWVNGTYNELSAVGQIGSATCPGGAAAPFFVVSAYFNSATGVISVECSDVLAGSYSGGQITALVNAPTSFRVSSNDNAMGMECDAMFWAGVAP